MTFWIVLFIVGSLVMAVRIYVGMLDTDLMPLACPRCYHGNDSTLGGLSRPWYQRGAGGAVYCAWCRTAFREHPNGSLVEDRPVIDARDEPNDQ